MGMEKSRNPRSMAMLLDFVHIVVGIVIVALAVISFINPEDHMLLFPLIFLLAAFLNAINGIYKIRLSVHERKRKPSGIFLLLFSFLLLALAVISGISIWWR